MSGIEVSWQAVTGQSEKAWKIEYNGQTFWAPKSKCTQTTNGINVPGWVIQKNSGGPQAQAPQYVPQNTTQPQMAQAPQAPQQRFGPPAQAPMAQAQQEPIAEGPSVDLSAIVEQFVIMNEKLNVIASKLDFLDCLPSMADDVENQQIAQSYMCKAVCAMAKLPDPFGAPQDNVPHEVPVQTQNLISEIGAESKPMVQKKTNGK